jgi:hypothetical protein
MPLRHGEPGDHGANDAALSGNDDEEPRAYESHAPMMERMMRGSQRQE